MTKWVDRIAIAKKAAEAWADESGAKRFIDEYNGDYRVSFKTKEGPRKVAPINEVFAYVQADIAVTNNRDPYIAINPKSGSVQDAKLWEVAINQEWRVLNTKEELELEIVDKDLVGFGFHKVGMKINSEGTAEDDTLKITDQRLYSERVDWKDVLWNIGSKRPPLDCQWMAQRIVTPLEELKEKYPNAADLEGVQSPEVDAESYKNANYKDDIKVVVHWEIWSRPDRKIYFVADELKDKWLDAPRPWPEDQEEFPFLMYWDYLAAGKSRPMSAIAPWEQQILDTIILTAAAVNHVKRFNRQMIVKAGAISGEALDKFERGDDGAIIENTGSGDLNTNMKLVDYGSLPTDYYLLLDRLAAIKRETNGQPEVDRGGVTKTNTRTIGELQMIKAGAKGRTDRKVDRFETHQENIAEHMLFHMKHNYDTELLVTVTGDTPQEVIQALGDKYDPATRGVRFVPSEIQGDFDVEIKAGSTLPMDKQSRMQLYEMILQAVAPVAASGPMSPTLNALIELILEDSEVKKLQIAYQLEQKMALQKQQQEAAMQQVEAQKTQSETAKRTAQSQEIGANADIASQDAALGPIGRAIVEKGKNAPPLPAAAPPQPAFAPEIIRGDRLFQSTPVGEEGMGAE